MEYKTTVNDTKLELYLSELYDVACDAIVIPSNNRLLPSGTLRCSVLKKAGAKVQVECNRIVNQVSSVPLGDAVVTSGGELSAQHIIHANNSSRDVKSLMKATWSALKLADKKGYEKVVFCALSKDVQGFNMEACAKVMILTIKKYISEINENIKKICVFLENQEDYENFEKILKE
ncbi:MAG: macro domain-containing protein [Candidatus Lokiarchaeota archaeon]|nr:macro domain-containing protein [Candidatus Lokiarchaeota archaeon]